MRAIQFLIPDEGQAFLRQTISEAGGREVYFLGKVEWNEEGDIARLVEAEVFCRGDASSVPAIVEGAEEWDIAIHNHPSGGLEPSDADMNVASALGNKSVGFAIINNDADKCYLVVKPFRTQSIQPVDLDYVRWIFGDEGPLAETLDEYESREGQTDMAVEIARSLNENRVVACEAGTGVGKSFAYLVPSILWAVDNRERVVIATGTINLQEQLVAKDLPFLAKVLPREFEYSLLKGRSNFGCKRKLAELEEEIESAEDDDREMLEELVAWSKKTKGGSLADMLWQPPQRVWERAMSETDKSLKVECQHYGECFYYQARRRASRAQIVVANHHLFFSDLALRRQSGDFGADMVLPGYSRVVFDEAHHLEDVASDHLGVRFSRLGVRQRLGRMRSKNGRRGALVRVAKKLRSKNDPIAAEGVAKTYGEQLSEVAEQIDDVFEEIEIDIEAERADGTLRELTGDAETRVKIRYRGADEEVPLWERIRESLLRVRGHLDTIVRLNARALETLERSRVDEETRKSLALELTSFAQRLIGFSDSVDRFCDYDDDGQVRWLDTREGGSAREPGAIGFSTAPISVAEDLEKSLFSKLKSITMTSATLSVAGRSDFLGERLGFAALPSERFSFCEHSSPFDFERQVLLAVPTDIPDPTERGYEEKLPELLLRLVTASSGRAFVLFTSYSLLRRMFDRLESALTARGFRPLAQGREQRSELLRRFIESGAGVLFGTDSFWEGVDVRGSALEHVIITRLPFRVPTEPLQEARLEEISARGGNPFAEFTIPQAVLRFKQGFGRLIRARRDRGVVSVLDRRLLTKPYGKTFFSSLPKTLWCAAGTESVLERVDQFFRTQTMAE